MNRSHLRIIFPVILFFLLSSSCFSQSIKNFTADPVQFIKELQQFFSESNKDEGEIIMKSFIPVWNGGKLSSSQQEVIYKTANGMLKKRMKAFPDFKNYLTTLISFTDAGKSSSLFDSWQSGLDKLLLLPSKNFSAYMMVCNNLFKDNSLYVSSSTHWYSDNSDYTFDVDSLPKIIFPSMTLTCSAKGDSSVITETKGVYYPNRQLFFGEGGKVNWKRAGWDENIVHAELNHYAIDASSTEVKADSAVFYNSTYFQNPLTGKYHDKLMSNVTPETATYPRFESYTTELAIKNIVKDVDYIGGFSMMGNKMLGSGNKNQDAELIFHRDGQPFLVAASKGFVVRKDKITSDHASVTIFFEKDSVYQPGLELKYIVNERELALVRGEDGKSKSPYYDSYHEVDMYFDALYWKIDDPLIDLKMISGAGESKALFESSNYFRRGKFLKLQGISEVHPLYTIQQFAEKNQTKVVYTEDLAKYMHLPASEARNMLINFSNQGFVSYDADDDKAIIKDRLTYYLLSNTGKTDYDVIQFESVTKEKANASINLLNFEITLRGVDHIVLSDSQNVVIYPKGLEVHLKKNRDFTFAGRVHAGRFDFYGKEFSFDYQNFKINLNNVDSLRLKVESLDPAEVDQYGNRKLIPVRSVLQNITGDLLIDFQGNKSGLHDYPKYPIFNSKKESFVYYDKPYIQDGLYSKDKFYFHLDPFTIDSLDNFSREGLRFNGEFVSAGIFPDFRDTLRLQDDLSLGLIRETGPEGWPAYSDKGKFTSTVKLSNEGLHGDGTLDYLASTSHSADYLFLPDSMNTHAHDFTNRKETYQGVEFPAVKAGEVYVHWFPKNDVMLINKDTAQLEMYEKQAMMNGNLRLRPSGMTGEGIMNFAASELEAANFKYKLNSFGADTSDFRLTSDNTAALAFTTKNVQSNIDFTKRVGEFKSNGGGSYVTFPLNQYICYIDQFKWFMDQKEIELSSNSNADNNAAADANQSGLDLTGSDFISIEPRQDSLRFKAPFARYSLRDYLIKADKVALIQTADASVIPDSGKVVVERYAKMRTLKDARIVANNVTKYHTIYNASVNILGRKRYEGSGDYDYVDVNNLKHHLHFDKVAVDTTFQTYADGEVADTGGLALSPQFLFKGNVHLAATDEYLTFSGYAKPDFHCEQVEKNWIRFNGEIDPANVSIPLVNPVTDNGTRLAAAIAQTSDSTGIYSVFLMQKIRPSDREIVSASGVLSYNKAAKEFRITTKEKTEKPEIAGNYLSLNDSKCTVYGEGKINVGGDFGQLKMTTVGNANYNLNNDSASIEVMATIDFYFLDDALKMMAEQLQSATSLEATEDVGRPAYEKGLAELVGKEKADKFISELNLYGSFKKMPEELRHTLLISNMKLVWNNQSKSFRSVGPISLGSIDKFSINRKMDGKVEFIRKRSGDVLNIYLEPEHAAWFFFSYTRGLMQTISSYSGYNDAINKVKPEKRYAKGEKDQPPFEYMLSTDRKVKDFLKKMEPQMVEEEK
ncbi:MAG: hypothetical protein NT126_11210 [Bacteroidetes bacterium]|nr:hypothetical protein [Bacteroidota bacterium]